jgi:membrane peptidoglycan carboxypeptidase
MVGGRDYNESQFNRAADAQRQAGSTFKVFVYYAALLNGYSPDTTIDASPVTIGRWAPENYGGQQYGRMSVSDAFAHSVNSAAVRLATAVGLNNVAAAARELGLAAPLKQVPSMALGSNEVTLLDLTRAFASIRAGQPKIEPWGILALSTDGGGLRALSAPTVSRKELPKREALTQMMRNVVDRGTGRAASLGPDVAGKTGTSQDHRDAWFIGFNKDLVVGVWVGNDDQTPMRGVTGGSLPAQIWKRFVTAATPLLWARTEIATKEPIGDVSTPPSGSTQAQSNNASCNIEACASRYTSFRSSDCTYQPLSGGSRRVCDVQTRNPTDRPIGRAGSEVSDASSSPDTEPAKTKRAERVRPRRSRDNAKQPSLALGQPDQDGEMNRPRSPRTLFGLFDDD